MLTSCGITVRNTILEKIQHEAARIISGATKQVSIEKLLKEVGWDTLLPKKKT